jgi:hypothetical protein
LGTAGLTLPLTAAAEAGTTVWLSAMKARTDAATSGLQRRRA